MAILNLVSCHRRWGIVFGQQLQRDRMLSREVELVDVGMNRFGTGDEDKML